MENVSQLTPNDRKRVEHGLLPIDVFPARRLTALERMTSDALKKPGALHLIESGYEPWVECGHLVWRLRNFDASNQWPNAPTS